MERGREEEGRGGWGGRGKGVIEVAVGKYVHRSKSA